ncbi:PREDICTED: neprilysin-like [Ceratosolen solmsi marchali]|uniref:Neprilysin-like n=1 Tax=Ceratosolen solmsi marchali TaxID=326594 RepID=A0AAJ6YG88_9HYME|nr:PREDICTED: neprilysin-like [Ceratosolen solmsi marchali]
MPCTRFGLLVLVLGAAVATFPENIIINPCENFHTVVCKNQLYKDLKHSRSNIKSLVAKAQDNIITKLKGILEEEDEKNIFSPKILRTFYKSCMDTETIDAQGVKPIQSILKQLSGWPIIKNKLKNENVRNWQDLHTFYNKINVFPLFEISVNNDALKRSHKILLRQPKPIIREPLLYKTKTFHKYVEYIKTVASIIANLNESSVMDQKINIEAKQIASFEAEISKILEISERPDFYRPVTLKKFQYITNQLENNRNYTWDWVKIINKMYYTSSHLVTIEDIIDISSLTYFPKLMQLMDRTPMRIIVNYIHWRFIHQFLLYTNNKMRNLYFEMKYLMQEPPKNVSRWKFCGFEPSFDHAISYTFAKKYISPRSEKYVQRILSDIKRETIKTIKHSRLLNEDEKRMAERKILNINVILGIPESLKNISIIDNYYKKLKISQNYFSNILNLRKFYKLKEFETMKKNKYKLSENNNFMKITTISSIGSAYEFFDNRVLIKVENFVEPLFHPDYPEFKKYGILGFIMAYEIMHAFNDADSIENTNPRRRMFSEETKLKFWDKMDCFINQFDNYYIADPFDSGRRVYVDGERSAMENIADSAAIKIAFQAYYERSRKQDISSIQDDENFFTSFASLLCRPELEEFYLSRFNLALRTLPQFRIIGSLSNTNEFAKTFSCLSGDRMNPKRKCNFWN